MEMREGVGLDECDARPEAAGGEVRLRLAKGVRTTCEHMVARFKNYRNFKEVMCAHRNQETQDQPQ